MYVGVGVSKRIPSAGAGCAGGCEPFLVFCISPSRASPSCSCVMSSRPRLSLQFCLLCSFCCWCCFLSLSCNGRALDRVTKQKHRSNRQKLSKKCPKIVFSVPLDNFWTFFDSFRTFCRHSRFLGCPTICPLQSLRARATRRPNKSIRVFLAAAFASCSCCSCVSAMSP